MRCIPSLLIFWTLLCSGVSQNLRQGDSEARTTSTTTKTTTTGGEHATTTARRQAQAMVGIDALIQAFKESRTRLLNRLQMEYGPSYQAMFVDTHPNRTDTLSTIGRNAFYKGTANAPTAWERTKRKMMIRILQYMSEGKVKDYVWATAGDSGAAGHGNFFGEQYTMVLQRQAADMFMSVGLNFVARPFAMHSSTSAPELAACVREIYGSDVDMVTWDFATTDGRWHWRMEMFGHRVMLLPKYPTMLVLGPGLDTERQSTVEHLVSEGMAALRLDEAYMNAIKNRIPDSHYHANVESLPESVRFLRCGPTLETGLGGCIEHKFTHNGTCDDRGGQTNWHHGWKWHAFHGNLYALFLMEMIDDALQAIKQAEVTDPKSWLDQLLAEEDEQFKAFETSTNFKYSHKWDIEGTELTTEMFYHQRVYCHTARLPAQTRYLGHVFNKDRHDNWHDYKKGMSASTMNNEPKKELRVTYSPRERHGCEVPLHIDSRDFFFATPNFGDYQTVIIPNTEEFKAYGPHQPKGYIAMCAAACTHSECNSKKLLQALDINKREDVLVMVNGELVAEATRFDDCFLLRKEDGGYKWEIKAGRYEVAIKVLTPYRYFRISSFIVW